MDRSHWMLVLNKDEQGTVTATLYEETPDGLDSSLIAAANFGPFDTCKDVTDWLCRHWSPRARLPLR